MQTHAGARLEVDANELHRRVERVVDTPVLRTRVQRVRRHTEHREAHSGEHYERDDKTKPKGHDAIILGYRAGHCLGNAWGNRTSGASGPLARPAADSV